MSDITVTVKDGVTVDVTVAGGSSVTVEAPASSSIEVTNKGPKGDTGETGPQGPTGYGVAAGGTENQVLQKNSGVDYDTKWSAYRLPGADGNADEVLTTNGAGTLFFTQTSTVYETVNNASGGTMGKGTPVHIIGEDASGNPTVIRARADSSGAMPCHFVLNESIADGATGQAILSGMISDVNTSGFSAGDALFVGATGGYTTTKPTGTNLIQKIAVVSHVDSSEGSGYVMGAGRSNDIPNIPDGQIWIGNASGVATPTDFAVSLDSTPQLGGDLDVNGNKIVSASGGDIRIEPTTTGDVIVRPVTGDISLQCQTGVELDGKSFPASIKFLEADTQSPRHSISFFAPSTWDSNLVFTLPSADGSDGQVLKTNGSGVLSFVDKMDDVSDDTTPQLGGDLDVNGNKITSASNGDITIDPDGTGAIIFKSDDIQFDGDGGLGVGKIKLYESDVLGSNFIALSAPLSVTSDITFILPDGYGTSGQALMTNGIGTLSWGTVLDGNADTLNGVTSFKPQGATAAQLAIYDNDESNYVILRAPANLTSNTTYYLPATDGSSGQVLQTNASGIMSWTSVGTVDTSGTPADDQLAVFTDADTIEGDANLKWNGSKLTVSGELTADRINVSAKTALSSAGNYAIGSEILGTVYSTSSLSGEAGKVHYLGSSTSLSANASTEAGGSGMLVVVTDAEDRAELLTRGVVRVSTTLTSASIGDIVYLDTTAGSVTTTAPTGSGNVVRVVGHVVKPSANMIYFNPSSDWIVVA